MGTVRSTLELYDAVTAPMMNIINAVNMGVGAMENMQQTMNESIDPSGIQSMRDYLDQAAASVTALNAEFEDLQAPIRESASQQDRFNRELREGAAFAGNLKGQISSVIGAYVGIAGIRKALSFVQGATSAFDTQLNAERQLVGVLANMLDEDYIAQFELETSADITGAIDDIAAVQNSIDEVIIPVSAETRALTAAFDTITQKASEIQDRGIYGDEIMIAAAAEFSTYFSDTDAIEMMMDTLANYAMGMSGGGALDSTAMVNYATNLGKLMTGAYDAMTKKGFEFSDAQKAIIEGEATQEQIIAALGAEYVNMTSDMQAAAAISQVIDEAWAGLYDNMSKTPQGKIIQMSNAWGDLEERIGGRLYPAVERLFDVINDNWETVETVMLVFTDGLNTVIIILSAVADVAFSVADIFISNWSWIGPIIAGVAAALAVYNGVLLLHNVRSLLAAGAQYVLGGALARNLNLTNGLTLAFGALVVAIGLYTNSVNEAYGLSLSFAGMLGGALMVILSGLGNIVIGLANTVIGRGVSIYNFIADLVNNFCSITTDPIGAVIRYYVSVFDLLLSLVENFANAIDGVFKTDLASGIKGLRSDLNSAVAEQFGVAEEVIAKIDLDDAYLDYIDYYEAFDAGYYLGEDIANKFGMSEADYSAYNAINELLNNTNSISESTGAIADSMEITEEDLKYLRDIAEQETVNRFTTAEINIEQTNHNNISSEMDLDGLVSGLTDAVNEAVDIIAEGVHA